LRGELELELAGEVLPGELLVLADVRRRHARDASCVEQDAETPLVDTTVVGDDLEIGDASVVHRLNERGRDAAEPEPADRERRAVRHIGHRLQGRGDHLVHP